MVTLVCGLPGSGKTSYVKKYICDGLCYDLDYIAGAFRLKNEHEEFHKEARFLANEFLNGFLYFARHFSDNIFVIRTAPDLDELERINPDKIIIMRKQFDITHREDAFFADFDEEIKISKLTDIEEYALQNKVQLEII